MFNPLKMAGDMKGMEKMLKPALEKFMQESGFVKESELKKLEKEVKNSGLTIVPLKLFINDKGFAKLRISLAKGKKLFDKRETIKDRDNKRDLDRVKKNFK